MNECRQLVWDYRRGDVICVDNGVVVDRIYDYGPVYRRMETVERERVELRKRLRRYGYRGDRELRAARRRLRRHYRLLRLAGSAANRGDLEVDYDKLLRSGRFVFTVYSRRSMEVINWLEEKGLRPILDRVIGALERLDPVYVAKSLRGRYVLAYLVYGLLRGRVPRYGELGEIRGSLSYTTFSRLLAEAHEIVERYGDVLRREVAGDAAGQG